MNETSAIFDINMMMMVYKNIKYVVYPGVGLNPPPCYHHALFCPHES